MCCSYVRAVRCALMVSLLTVGTTAVDAASNHRSTDSAVGCDAGRFARWGNWKGAGTTRGVESSLQTVVPAGTRFEGATIREILRVLARVCGRKATLGVRGLAPHQAVTVDLSGQTVIAAVRRVIEASDMKNGTMYQIDYTAPDGARSVIVGRLTRSVSE